MGSVEHPQIQLLDVRVLKSSFEVLDPGSLGERPADQKDSTFNVQVSSPAPGHCAALLTLVGRPFKGQKPYAFEVQVAGLFTGLEGTTDEQLHEFCAVRSPAILFPMLREVVHTITRDGGFGAMLLPLINLDALARQGLKQAGAVAATAPVAAASGRRKRRP